MEKHVADAIRLWQVEQMLRSAPTYKPGDPRIPDSSGVYVVHDRLRVLDVGESARVRRRLQSHDRRRCWLEKALGEMSVSVISTPHKKKAGRRSVEAPLRVGHKPPCGVR